ncbi:MAG: Cof-type HAD-IIB family hydrolase [Hespellia sp.]|nr:Cof-type HAD-IIB family hydrolase [Hespellia sp.]
MDYEILVLDLDGTLTNSKKEISPPTRQALIEIQQAGRKVVLASGRPTQGVVPLAKELRLDEFGGYILSFNGARIINFTTGQLMYNKQLPLDAVAPTFEIVKDLGVDLITYENDNIISGIKPNEFVELESRINSMPIKRVDNFSEYVNFPINKMIAAGDPKNVAVALPKMKQHFHGYLNIYMSDPFFLEIMPQQIDKAYSLLRLLESIGLTADQMICCGDGYNDLSMIETAGLGVAMENAQPLVKESADYITLSNDEDGVLHVINTFMR